MPPKSTPGVTFASPEVISAFRRRLMRWFRSNGRNLPWRKTRDPYHIVVSEFMLQQTQVSRVEQYYTAFLTQYPTIHHLAAASPAMVRESWQGLGYYRRATNLHRLAQEVVNQRSGDLPDDIVELRKLPGIGRYTAGAVAAFAFEQAEPAVDTNVERVIRRAFFSSRSQPPEMEPRELCALSGSEPEQQGDAHSEGQRVLR